MGFLPLILSCVLVFATFTVSLKPSVSQRRPILPTSCFAHQDAIAKGIVVKSTKNKGLGAYAGALILAGSRVGDYKGEILSVQEVQARYWETRKRKTKDRRWVKSRRSRNQGMSGDYLFDMGDDLFLDGEDADISSWCRFMNHAKEESSATSTSTENKAMMSGCNLETKCSPVVWNGNEMEPPMLWFVALRDISEGEELLYDYGDSYWNS